MSTPAPTGRLWRWLRLPLFLLVAIVTAALVGALWIVGTTAGARVMLAAAGLKAENLDGRIAGRLFATSLEYSRPNLRIRVEKPDLDWAPLALIAGRFEVTYLKADVVEIARVPSKERAGLPIAFEPPLEIRVHEADVKALRIGTLSREGAFTAELSLDNLAANEVAGAREWTFDHLRARTAIGDVEVSGTLGAHTPFALEAKGQLAGEREGRRYRVEATARGTLAKIDAALRGAEGGITGDAVARIEPFEAQPLKHLRGNLSGIDVQAFAPKAPHTAIAIQADLAAKDGALAGTARFTNAEAGPLDRDRLPIVEARTRVNIRGNRYEFTESAIQGTGGGTATGRVVVEGGRVETDLEVRAVDLATVHGKLRPTKLTGAVVTRSSAEAQRYEVKLADPRFEIAGAARLEGGWLRVEEARIAQGSARARLVGAIQVEGERRFEVEGSLEHIDPSAFAAVPAGDLSGSAKARGRFLPALAGELAVDLAPSKLAGLALVGRVNVEGDEKRLARSQVNLSLGDALLEASGALGNAGDVLEAKLVVPDATAIVHALGHDLAGRIDAQLRLAGTFADPSIQLRATGETLRLPGGLRVASASIGVDGTRTHHQATLDAQLPESRLKVAWQGGLDPKAAKITWRGNIESFDLTGPNPLKLTSPATLVVARELVEVGQAVLKSDLGDARFVLTRWTPDRVEAKGTSEGVLTRPILRLLGVTPQARTNLVLAAEWDLTASQTLDGYVRLKRVRGDVRLGEPALAMGLEEFDAAIEAARGEVKASASIRGTRLGRLAARLATQVRRDGDTWHLPREASLSGEVSADLPAIGWAAAWLGPDASLEGRVEGKVAVAGTLATPSWKGFLAAEGLRLHDSNLGFEVDQGRIRLALDEREIAIEAFELESQWREKRRAERRLADVTPPDKGTIHAEGRIDFATRAGQMKVRMQSYPVSQLSTRFLAASGEAQLTSTESGLLTVNGAFKADAGFFGIAESAPPSLSDDVLVDRGAGAAEGARERQRLALDVRFNLGDHLHFSGRGLSTRLTGEVRLRGEPGRNLVSSGQIRTVGGSYDAYGQELAIERGVLNFQGPLENPGLNVLAVRDGLPVVAGVEIQGTVARPAVRLYSRPEVPDHEKLSWLVLGRGPTEANESDIGTLFAAANALLGTGREGRRLVRQFGFDEMRISRADASSALGVFPQSTVAGRTNSGAGSEVFTVGKRLTKDIYVSYQHGLADAEATLKFSYQVTQKLQFLLRASNNPGFDAVYRFTFE